jgi:hypothetical protein
MSGFEKFVKTFTSQEAMFFYAVLFVMWIIIFYTVTVPASYVTTYHVRLGLGLGTAFWIWVAGQALPYFSVSVPEVTGLVTINYLTGNMKTYATGFQFRFPWEQVKYGNYINLRMMTTDNMQETFPCADGPVVIVKWANQYRTTVKKLPAYISVSEAIINRGLNEVSSGSLSLKIRSMNSEEIRSQAKKKELEEAVFHDFETATIEDPNNPGRTGRIDEIYGIDITLVPISDVDFEQSYQEARSTDQVMSRLRGTARKIREDSDGSITDKDALDATLIVAGKGVTKEVRQETRVFDVTPAAGKVVETAAGIVANAISRR